jgi:hypothetical protein
MMTSQPSRENQHGKSESIALDTMPEVRVDQSDLAEASRRLDETSGIHEIGHSTATVEQKPSEENRAENVQ